MNNLITLVALALGLLCTSNHPEPKTPTYELQEALDQGLIRLSEISYVGQRSMRLELENIHGRKDLNILIEPGLQFTAVDTSEQDQILLEGRTIMVKAGSKRSALFSSYCTQADRLSPGAESQFKLNHYAEGKLMDLARFLNRIPDIDYTAQHAIWVLTNDHDLKGLHHDDADKAAAIQDYVANLSGKPRPSYTVRYRDSGTRQRAFTPEVLSIYGVHEYNLDAEGVFSCRVYSESGTVVKEVFKDMRQERGHIRFTFQLQTTRLPKGKYVSRVFRGDQIFQEIWLES